MATGVEAYRYTERLRIAKFDITVPAVAVGKVIYFPVIGVCRGLGISHKPQLRRLQEDSRFQVPGATRIIPIMTKTGLKPTTCIKKADYTAKWLGLIDPAHVRSLLSRERLEQFQDELFAAADRFLWGKDDSTQPTIQGTLTINGACPHCGGKLCVIVGPDGTHFQALPGEPDEEGD